MKSPRINSPPIDMILCGDCREVLSTLPGGYVDCVVTSPPYFQQRDYDDKRQLGQEDSVAQYVGNLTDAFRQVRRVLKPSGGLWIVLGDKYVRGELQATPWRVALAMIDDGWKLRSDVIWHKPNAMPSSAKKRPTTDHEYVFFFTRSNDYFYDADAIREPHVTFTDESQMKGGRRHFGTRGGTPEAGKNAGNINLHDGRWDQAFHPRGRNKRTVWKIPLSKNRDTHFAVFPNKLVEVCIAATCPENGIVLDPFSGSGTTALVAQSMRRHYIGIDCSQKYVAMARRRLSEFET